MSVTVLKRGRGDLCRLFAERGYTCGAEIGVWEGKFSEQICAANPGVRLICVDPWMPYSDYRERKNDKARLDQAYTDTKARLAPYSCRILRLTSLDAAKIVPDGSLDFIYIDGNHEAAFVREDLAAWVPKVRRGGIVAGHDYTDPNPKKPFIQVKPVVDAYVRDHGIAELCVLAGDKSPSFYWEVA